VGHALLVVAILFNKVVKEAPMKMTVVTTAGTVWMMTLMIKINKMIS
jgi:hypothetical protein